MQQPLYQQQPYQPPQQQFIPPYSHQQQHQQVVYVNSGGSDPRFVCQRCNRNKVKECGIRTLLCWFVFPCWPLCINDCCGETCWTMRCPACYV